MGWIFFRTQFKSANEFVFLRWSWIFLSTTAKVFLTFTQISNIYWLQICVQGQNEQEKKDEVFQKVLGLPAERVWEQIHELSGLHVCPSVITSMVLHF